MLSVYRVRMIHDDKTSCLVYIKEKKKTEVKTIYIQKMDVISQKPIIFFPCFFFSPLSGRTPFIFNVGFITLEILNHLKKVKRVSSSRDS